MATNLGNYDECLDNARALLGDGDDGAALWEANDQINRAIAIEPDSAEAWLLKCQILSALGDDVAALAAVAMAISLDRFNAEAHYWHTAILADLERYDEALQAVERAFCNVGSGDDWLIEDLYYEKAALLDASGLSEAALATYEAGLARCPDSLILKSGLEPLRRDVARQRFRVIPGGLA